MNKKGFTLIEVLVVIAIIGILSGIIIANMGWAVNSANDARRKSNIDEIRKSVVYYKTQSVDGLYPIEADECTIGGGDTPCETLASALSVILPTPPVDPVSGDYYTYYSEDGTDFTVSSTLSDSTTYSYTASTGFSTEEAPSYASTCASATNSQVQCTETTDGSYVIDTFTYLSSSGTTSWTVPSGVTSVDYLVVGGGGGPGTSGGGGGGFRDGTILDIGTSAVTVTIGNGGSAGANGGNSRFGDIYATGGGHGGIIVGYCPDTGGSGGGGHSDCLTGAAGNAGGYNPVEGYKGGNGIYGAPAGGSGGGGGAGGAGHDAGGTSSAGDGGIGKISSITGDAVYYAGGGGGGAWDNASGYGGVGGSGGGGNGYVQNNQAGTSGVNGLGGGAGGTRSMNTTGGSGVVIVRFLHP